MADTTAVFDTLVFDFAFDTVDVIPALLKLLVEPQYGKIAAGQTVAITIYVIDNMTTPGRSYPFNTPTEPAIELFSPGDVSLGAAAAMRQVGTGIYTYSHLTNGDSLGPYSAVFTLTNGNVEMVSKKHVVFTII
jgi:hypothetical protein